MKMFVFGSLTAVALMVMAAWTCLEFGLADMRCDENPPAWENRLMYSAVHASVRLKQIKNLPPRVLERIERKEP